MKRTTVRCCALTVSMLVGTGVVLVELSSASAQVLVSGPQCNGIVIPAKRRRCRECIGSGGRFHKRGMGVGRCEMPPPPPAPAPPPPPPHGVRAPAPPPGDILVTHPECSARIANPHKRRRCNECVSRRGRFFKEGMGVGRCEMAPPPPPRHHRAGVVLVTPGECSTRIADPHKRRRCHECVNRRGRFHREGMREGQCEEPAAPPPPAPDIICDTPVQCNTGIVDPHKRRRCHECVNQRGRFHREGGGPGRCQHAPPPPPPPRPGDAILDTHGQCNAMVADPHKRRRCHECVTRRGRFHREGARPGHCQMR